MAKSLVIVESPAKAKTISKFLGKNYVVKASMGHVRDLPRSQFGVDVEHNFDPKYITIRGKGPILKELKDAAKKNDCVLLATDPDREGEAIAWHLAKALKIDENNCRIEFREITKQAIQQAVKNPRDIAANLVSAQQARRILDRIVGYKLSPLLWAKVKKGLSAGRVQSVTVRLICDREAEINEFVPEEYWSVTASLSTHENKEFFAKLFKHQAKKIELHTKDDATRVEQAILNKQWVVESVTKRERKRNPAPPFTTSTMQQEAARKLNFTSKKTMRIAQQLYEGLDIGSEGTVGLITYIRTDAMRIAEEASDEVRSFIENQYGTEFVPHNPPEYKTKSGAQEAHEAIRPTSTLHTPKSLKEYLGRDQMRLYRLIWERFVASQMAPALINGVTTDIKVDDYIFRATGSSIKFSGFMQVYVEGSDDVEEKEKMLPEMSKGESLVNKKLDLKQHFTQPPPRYSEAMLVKILEEKGIGRPSTYAPIIDTVVRRGYVTLEEKRFIPTELGTIVVELLLENFGNLLDVDFTASMEQKLDQVEEGKVDWVDVMHTFYEPFAHDLEKAHELLEKIEIEDEVTDTPCDQCGSLMVIKWGRFGKFLACPGYPECKNTKPFLTEVGVGCPTCSDGQVVERKSKKGRIFYGCSTYPECQFTSWNRPVNEKCPHCDQVMFLKKKSDDKAFCANKECSGG